MSGTGALRIGEVHSLLRQDYPDIELSKIRYYEEKGLVQPARSRKGYRLYSERDVACLREAIRLAQEEFVPLKVVRVRLIEQGLLTEAAPGATVGSPRRVARDVSTSVVSLPAPESEPRTPLRVVSEALGESSVETDKEFYNAGEILFITKLTPEALNQLIGAGLVAPQRVHGETVFRVSDVRICERAKALLERGVDLRFLTQLRRLAQRETGIVEDLTAPLRRGARPEMAGRTRELVANIASEVCALRDAFSRREFDDFLRD